MHITILKCLKMSRCFVVCLFPFMLTVRKVKGSRRVPDNGVCLVNCIAMDEKIFDTDELQESIEPNLSTNLYHMGILGRRIIILSITRCRDFSHYKLSYVGFDDNYS